MAHAGINCSVASQAPKPRYFSVWLHLIPGKPRDRASAADSMPIQLQKHEVFVAFGPIWISGSINSPWIIGTFHTVVTKIGQITLELPVDNSVVETVIIGMNNLHAVIIPPPGLFRTNSGGLDEL